MQIKTFVFYSLYFKIFQEIMLALYVEIMEKQKLILIRDFLLKTFVVGLGFAILLFVMTTAFWDKWSTFLYAKFLVPKDELGELVVDSFLHLRLFLVFVILVPGIAMHWLVSSKK